MQLLPLEAGGRTLTPPLIIAGPCSAETADRVLDTARRLSDAGIDIFRAGVWKPRTSPGCFEGVGEEALAWLRQVKERTGMLTAVEVATGRHVEAAVAAGMDILWIGARTSGNPFAVQEIADTMARIGAADTPVLVKNPLNPDLELWIGALKRLESAGIRRLGAVHRGFSIYGSSVYRNEPLWRIPLELRSRYPQLPLICDPSHIGGTRQLVEPLARKAIEIGFDGLIIESHCCPENAWSDAAQQITPERLAEIISHLEYRDTPVAPESIDEMRKLIDSIDAELLDVLARRMEVSRRIGEYKRSHRMPVVQPGRYGDIVASRVADAERLGMSREFMRSILSAIHEESVRQQVESSRSPLPTDRKSLPTDDNDTSRQ